jgi:RimJ/RimL family protein N-acetyltransferase
MRLHTARLTLDPLQSEDAGALYGYRSDPAISRYQGWHPASLEHARDFIEASQRVAFDTPDTWCQRAIRLRDSGELVGDLGLHFLADATVELGISLAHPHQGRGLAAETLEAVLGCLFESLHKHRAFASVDPRNHACMKLLERVGMRKEAHFRESLWLGGEWVDDVVFAMLAREWPGSGRGGAIAGKL